MQYQLREEPARDWGSIPKFSFDVVVNQLSKQNEDGQHDNAILDVNEQQTLFPKSQVTDYIARGDALHDYNVLLFFTDTYEREVRKKDRESEIDETDETMGKGRPRHERVPYQSQHPKCSSVFRIIRRSGHNNLPNFIGAPFPHPKIPTLSSYIAHACLCC